MKRFIFVICCLLCAAPTWADSDKIEFLKADITPDNLQYLMGAACRNFDWIVHLDINVNWPREKLDHVGGASDDGLVIKAHDLYYNIELNIYTNEQPDLEKPSHINGYYFVKNDAGSTGNWSISMYPLKYNPNLPEVKKMEGECFVMH